MEKENSKQEAKQEVKPEAQALALDPKYLKGLTYRYARHEKVMDKKLGKERTISTPLERPLTTADVMSWRDTGEVIVIATKDGKKHEIRK